eukprot:3929170-Amphidinium_carterae.1
MDGAQFFVQIAATQLCEWLDKSAYQLSLLPVAASPPDPVHHCCVSQPRAYLGRHCSGTRPKESKQNHSSKRSSKSFWPSFSPRSPPTSNPNSRSPNLDRKELSICNKKHVRFSKRWAEPNPLQCCCEWRDEIRATTEASRQQV